MQFIDLSAQYRRLKTEIDKAVLKIFDEGVYICGPQVGLLEQRLAQFTGRKHCIACSNGTDALMLPLLEAGIGRGDAVFTTAFSFFATAEVVAMRGAVPVFVDIDPDTFNIDCDELEQAILQCIEGGKYRPKMILPVDLFGLPADYKRIEEIAQKYDLWVMEDAAQGFGGVYHGKRAGSFGIVSATSFFPAKPLGCYGDGGALFTDDDDKAEAYRSLQIHGKGQNKYDNVRLGVNARLDTIQAAVLNCKLDVFEDEIQRRQRIAQRYHTLLAGKVKIPYIPEGSQSVYAQYTIRLADKQQRDLVVAAMKKAGIPTMIYYEKPLPMQKAFDYLGHRPEDFPKALQAAQTVLSLPMHPYLTMEDQDRVVQALLDALHQING